MFGTALNNAQLTHSLTSDIHDSKHAYLPKANSLNIWRKFVCVENKEITFFMNIYVMKNFGRPCKKFPHI